LGAPAFHRDHYIKGIQERSERGRDLSYEMLLPRFRWSRVFTPTTAKAAVVGGPRFAAKALADCLRSLAFDDVHVQSAPTVGSDNQIGFTTPTIAKTALVGGPGFRTAKDGIGQPVTRGLADIFEVFPPNNPKIGLVGDPV
jgi:hypothetical protein